MFCEQCGSKVPEGAKFCPKCGSSCSDDTNVPENNGGTKSGKKPKRHRKKSKAVIALCTAVAVVGVSVGGVVLYKTHEKNERVQKYYDIMMDFYILSYYLEDEEEYNYEKLSKKEKKEYNEALSKVGRNVKNHYTTYPEDEWEFCDKYVEDTFESGVCSDTVLNLPEDAYNTILVDSYTISKGKIYGKVNVGSEDEPEIYQVEGNVVNPTDYIEYLGERTLETWEENRAEVLKDYEISDKTFNYNMEFIKDIFKKMEENIAVGKDETILLFKIKDIKGNTLQIDDCYVYTRMMLQSINEGYDDRFHYDFKEIPDKK